MGLIPLRQLRPACVVLGLGDNGVWVGYVENSFTMSISPLHTQLFVTNHNGPFGIKFDGYTDAENQRDMAMKNHPLVAWAVFDIDDPELPVVLDLDKWEAARQFSDKTLSGVVDKFGARNVKFEPK